MDYEWWFWFAVAFMLGRASRWRIYVGPDKDKYRLADWGILLRNQ